MCLYYQQYTYAMVYEYYGMGIICHIIDYMECLIDRNMALRTDDLHILYYYKDMYSSIIMGHSYFRSHDYLVV